MIWDFLHTAKDLIGVARLSFTEVMQAMTYEASADVDGLILPKPEEICFDEVGMKLVKLLLQEIRSVRIHEIDV